jgi:hypothetical protein
MPMTERERMLAVYRGETPDQVPLFLDVSHWFYHKHHIPFDLSVAHLEPEYDLIAYHKQIQAGFYIPNLNSYYDASYPPDVNAITTKVMTPDGPEIIWRLETPIGAIERRRKWEEKSYSWNVSQHGVHTAQDLRVLAYALSRRTYTASFERYTPWVDLLDGWGVVYMGIGYSAMGYILGYWMGIEETMYACHDMPDVMHEVVDQINANVLECIDVVCKSPAEVIILGDNFSSDIQSPRFFKTWSEPFYREAFRRIRAAGKYSAVHVDGRLRGLLRALAEAGADCIDAVTPTPMGDLTPQQCRDEAGPNLILSGGVSPDVWVGDSDEAFKQAVIDWLEIRKRSPRLILAAGDQVPPYTPEHRIFMMRELADKYGRY